MNSCRLGWQDHRPLCVPSERGIEREIVVHTAALHFPFNAVGSVPAEWPVRPGVEGLRHLRKGRPIPTIAKRTLP